MANLADFVKSVRVILDENQESDSILDTIYSGSQATNSDQLKIDELIKGHIAGALRYVYLHADSTLIGPGRLYPPVEMNDDKPDIASFSEGITAYAEESGEGYETTGDMSKYYSETKVTQNDRQFWFYGKVRITNNVLRIVAVKMKSWIKPVVDFMSPKDPRYLELFSRFEGVRASVETPIAVDTVDIHGRCLELFPALGATGTSTSSGDEVEYLRVIYDIDTSADDNTDLSGIGTELVPSLRYTVASFVCTSLDDHDRAAKFMDIANNLMIIDKQ